MAEILVPVRTKDCRHGRFTYPAADQYIGRSLDLYGEYSESEAALFAQILRPGSIVIEAGANIGALSVPIARAVGPAGRVIAYEPQAALATLLVRNLADNGLAHAEVRRAALGAHPGTIRVPPLDYQAGANFGGVALGGEAGDVVPVDTIDALALARLDFVKIDVEGMEIDVLAGGTATIRSRQPVLYVENDRVERSRELITMVLDLGYRAWWHFPKLFNPQNFFGHAVDVFHVVSANLLCMPASRTPTIIGGTPVLGPDDDWQSARYRI